MQHNVCAHPGVCMVIFAFINIKLCISYSESPGAEGEALYLYHTNEMKWATAFLTCLWFPYAVTNGVYIAGLARDKGVEKKTTQTVIWK